MAASFRSHFSPPPQRREESVAAGPQRKPSSRLPTRAPTPEIHQTRTAQHVSKLATRPSSRNTEKARQLSSRTERTQQVPMTAAQYTGRQSTSKGPVAPSSAALSAGILPSQPFRHNDSPAPPSVRTPSLVSGSSASTFDSPRSFALRRKPSTIENYAAQKRANSTKMEDERTAVRSGSDVFNDTFTDSVLGIALPPTSSSGISSNLYAPVPPVEDPYSRAQTSRLQPARDITPPYAQSATPSTRYTDSPFSHAPTPSSASSYSPGVTVTTNSVPIPRQPTPTRSRPPVTRRANLKEDSSRLGLPPVRESSTSSSASTVKPSGQGRTESSFKSGLPPNPAYAKTSSIHRKPVPISKETEKSRPEQPRAAIRLATRVPPELAHLNIDTPSKTQRTPPPVRPSRDGTPNLMDHQHTSPIVQSNLPSVYTTYHKRTPSQETPVPAASPESKSRFAFASSKASSRQPSPRVGSAISPPPSARMLGRGQAPEAQAPASAPESHSVLRRDSPAIGTAPSPSKSPRFGFFSRKPKPNQLKPLEKPDKQSRKGPAAGTGHEGYGRFGIRGRSGSTTSNASIGRSPSADSTASSAARPTTSRKGNLTSKDGSELHDFLKERLTPVVLRGSGSMASSEDSTPGFPSLDLNTRNGGISSTDSSLSSLHRPQLLPSAMQSAGPKGSPAKRPYIGSRKPSDSSEDDVAARYPTLAARRSFIRALQADEKVPVMVPPPRNTRLPSQTSSVESYDAEMAARPQTNGTLQRTDDFDRREGLWLKSKPAEPLEKPVKKWNFFQRAHSAPRNKGKERAVVADEMLDATFLQSPYRSVAHYAMLDPAESVALSEVEQIMLENETSPEDSMTEERAPPKVVPYERRHISLLPSPPKQEMSDDSAFKARPLPPRIMVGRDSPQTSEVTGAQVVTRQTPYLVDIPKSPTAPANNAPVLEQMMTPEMPQFVSTPKMPQATSTPEMQQGNNSSPRQPRLSPVGRIPRVVSKRDRDRKLPDNSFSRPFARTQPKPTVKPPGSLYNQIRELASPIESQSQPVSSTSGRSGSTSGDPKRSSTEPTSVSATDRTSLDAMVTNEFLKFGQRKDSEQSYSSSSGAGSYKPTAMTVPQSQEDDIWNEYNDLIDEVMPQKSTLSAISTSSSLGAPFQYASMLYDSNSPSLPTPLNVALRQPGPPPVGTLPSPPMSNSAEALSVPQQIARFLQPANSPNTPYSLSEFVAGYGERDSSRIGSFVRQSLPSAQRVSSSVSHRGSQSSSRYSRASGHSRSASLPEAGPLQKHSSLTPSARFRDTQLLDIAESDSEQASDVSLRFGALMTSKWLSFGRVLFSPAHNEMNLSDEPRVLILDGLLGNDWSYYCALSYPSAVIYNLAPTAFGAGPHLPSANWSSLPNHRHIPHPSVSAPFPFPRGFFTAVVFRFPVATSDQAYHACIFECKRVLRPGGHLEISVLDLDLMNMGSRARKAVRGLKTRLQQRDQSVSLRNMSDVMMRLVGRRGFEEVQRCIVGVPVAGRIPRSQDLSSTSSGRSGFKQTTRDREIKGDSDREFSFADVLNDARGSQLMADKGNDEGITKMVAKVGRWWYSTCYETSLLSTDRSIWNDRALLRECEKQGTSFRLLVCHAQKPMCARRRTVSV